MKTTPYRHQKKEFDEHYADQARALLWQMRTGKTKVVIDTACALHEAMEIDGALVIAPNGVHVNWVSREIPAHSWDGTPQHSFAWRFSDPDNRLKFIAFLKKMAQCPGHLAWMTVNMESLIRDEVREAILIFRKAINNRFLVTYDESHHFGHPGAKRTSFARGLALHAAYRRILSGTAVENSPLHAFSQYELLKKQALGYRTYDGFMHRYAEFEMRWAGSRQFKAIARYVNTDELRSRMAQYSSVVLRSDCEDLPSLQEVVRTIDLSPKQAAMWRSLKKKELLALEEMGFVSPLQASTVITKLQQVEGGFLKIGKEIQKIEGVNPKMEALVEEVEMSDSPVLVWCQFVHEIKAVEERIRKERYSCATYYGGVPERERDDIRAKFRRGDLKVLIGQAQAAGEGHDFSAADLIVWYSQTPDARVRSQASERATAVGKKGVQVVHLMSETGADARWMGLTEGKFKMADYMTRGGMKELLESMDV